LSTWLRDYLYVPLGGNRHGEPRTYVNLMITMLLGGLWHGASWTFVVWGGLHGAYLALERWLGRKPGILATFLVVTITWVFFRAHTFADAWDLLRSMAGASGAAHRVLYWNDILIVAAIVGAMLFTHWRMRATRLDVVVAATNKWVVVLAWTLMAFALVAEQGAGDAFIYFAF
jgi:alginate O-acetyltransferase complex protein AlgI